MVQLATRFNATCSITRKKKPLPNGNCASPPVVQITACPSTPTRKQPLHKWPIINNIKEVDPATCVVPKGKYIYKAHATDFNPSKSVASSDQGANEAPRFYLLPKGFQLDMQLGSFVLLPSTDQIVNKTQDILQKKAAKHAQGVKSMLANKHFGCKGFS